MDMGSLFLVLPRNEEIMSGSSVTSIMLLFPAKARQCIYSILPYFFIGHTLYLLYFLNTTLVVCKGLSDTSVYENVLIASLQK